jgi:hypothetical protein
MFVLDGKPLSLDRAFTHAGIQYPSNWLRLATPEERAASGITEAPEPPSWDQRFYWGCDEQGALIPKGHSELVALWSATTRTTANTLLAPTDWVVIREADNGAPADSSLKQWREAIRAACNEKIALLAATSDTDALAAYATSSDYSAWPAQDAETVEEEPEAIDPAV